MTPARFTVENYGGDSFRVRMADREYFGATVSIRVPVTVYQTGVGMLIEGTGVLRNIGDRIVLTRT